MTTYVEEAATLPIGAADDCNGLSGDFRGDELAGVDELFRTRRELPGLAEYRALLELEDAKIVIP
jgi:hypothetical protein